jgi:hypothetical protein
MIRYLIAATAVLLTMSPAVGEDDPCGDQSSLLALTNEHGLLVLCAASGRVGDADSVCVATLGKWWNTEWPVHLASRTPRERVVSGLAWLCGRVTALPAPERANTISSLEAWVRAYCAVESLDGLVGAEELATAVAYVPRVADLIPRIELRSTLGRDVGSNLASAEHAGLHYALADRLADLEQDEQAEVLRDLWVEALR